MRDIISYSTARRTQSPLNCFPEVLNRSRALWTIWWTILLHFYAGWQSHDFSSLAGSVLPLRPTRRLYRAAAPARKGCFRRYVSRDSAGTFTLLPFVRIWAPAPAPAPIPAPMAAPLPPPAIAPTIAP